MVIQRCFNNDTAQPVQATRRVNNGITNNRPAKQSGRQEGGKVCPLVVNGPRKSVCVGKGQRRNGRAVRECQAPKFQRSMVGGPYGNSPGRGGAGAGAGEGGR